MTVLAHYEYSGWITAKCYVKASNENLTTCTDRFPRVTITPFSVENASEGRPRMFHSLTAVGLDRKTAKLKPGVHGICKSLT